MPARATEPMPPEVWEQVERFTHLYAHLQARKAGWEPALIEECWGVLDPTPEWALEVAASGKPGTHWCPILVPSLRERRTG